MSRFDHRSVQRLRFAVETTFGADATGNQSTSVDISSLGSPLTIAFIVSDVGDSIFATVVMVDDISVGGGGGGGGSGAVANACAAIVAGYADTVVVYRSLAQGQFGRFGQAGGGNVVRGAGAFTSPYVLMSPAQSFAMRVHRFMYEHGTQQEALRAISLASYKHAQNNPRAVMHGRELTEEIYDNSRWIVEPFHLFDCCMENDGAAAVVITSAERARDLKQPPVYVLGMGQGHPGNPQTAGFENEVNTGAIIARDTAFGMAGVTIDDIDVAELYDCYTYTTLVTLEDYGFCEKGEGGAFVSDGRIEPGGALPVNTGGGQLSGYYMWGMTPVSEAVIQTRGQGGERQVPKNDAVLVSTQGGILDHHATLILSPNPSNQ